MITFQRQRLNIDEGTRWREFTGMPVVPIATFSTLSARPFNFSSPYRKSIDQLPLCLLAGLPPRFSSQRLTNRGTNLHPLHFPFLSSTKFQIVNSLLYVRDDKVGICLVLKANGKSTRKRRESRTIFRE